MRTVVLLAIGAACFACLLFALVVSQPSPSIAADPTVSVPGPASKLPMSSSDEPGGRRALALFAPKTPPQSDASRVPQLVVTPQREAAALSFVRHHHSELADLLVYLKRDNPREYEKAVRELFRTSERLALAKEKDEERYQSELEIWKLESQIRLLVARLTMKPDDPAMREKLRKLLLDRVDLRIERQRLERDRLAARLERFEADIVSLESERSVLADQSFQELLQSVSNIRGSKVDRTAPVSAPKTNSQRDRSAEPAGAASPARDNLPASTSSGNPVKKNENPPEKK